MKNMLPDERIEDLQRCKVRILEDMKENRRSSRFLESLQIVGLMLLVIIVAAFNSWGLFRAGVLLNGGIELNLYSKILTTVLTGGCSAMGFLLFKIGPRLRRVCKGYVQEERLFTSQMHRVEMATSREEIHCLLRDYAKPRPKSFDQ